MCKPWLEKNMRLIENIRPFKSASLEHFVKVIALGQQVGWTPLAFAEIISDFDTTWTLHGHELHLNEALASFDQRSRAVDETFVALSKAGVLPTMPDYSALGGIDWFPVSGASNGEPLFLIKRFYVTCLGVQWQSVVMNGFTGDQYWTARRGRNVHDAPGKLDILAAGSMTCEDTVFDTLIHEAHTEAGLGENELKNAVRVGSLFLYYLDKRGFLRNEHLHVFDLDMGSIIPKTNLPEEVEGFDLMPIAKVMQLVEEGQEFKREINLVITDFLLRHGHITRDYPHYEALLTLLYQEKAY
ncbi:MAG: hypothetical protein JWM96_113 [Alphaproteobacteria bacterium]|nr:hypothetical protein [Alphaproteobacteria bacterium]